MVEVETVIELKVISDHLSIQIDIVKDVKDVVIIL